LRLKIDLHVHTYYSHDSFTTLKEVVAYAKRRGLDGVAITDHNTIKGALKLRSSDILVIPGIEVSTLEGHLLGINVTEQIPSKLGIEETIRLIHETGGIAVAPHPADVYRSPPSRRADSYDAVEVMNASSVPFRAFTVLSRRFAAARGLPETGGSDAHYGPEIGLAYTVVDSELGVDEVVSAIKAGSVSPAGRGVPLKFRVARTALRLKRKL